MPPTVLSHQDNNHCCTLLVCPLLYYLSRITITAVPYWYATTVLSPQDNNHYCTLLVCPLLCYIIRMTVTAVPYWYAPYCTISAVYQSLLCLTVMPPTALSQQYINHYCTLLVCPLLHYLSSISITTVPYWYSPYCTISAV